MPTITAEIGLNPSMKHRKRPDPKKRNPVWRNGYFKIIKKPKSEADWLDVRMAGRKNREI